MEEVREVNVDSDAHYGMVLEDSLEEEVTNCATKRANSSESQHDGHIFLSWV